MSPLYFQLLQMSAGAWFLTILGIVFAILVLLLFLVFPFTPHGRMWLRTVSAGLNINVFYFIKIMIGTIDVVALTELLIKARRSNVKIPIHRMEKLFYSSADENQVIEAMMLAQNAHETDITLDALENHALSGGDVVKTVEGLIAAKHADIHLEEEKKMHLNFETIAAIDHAGINVEETIKAYVTPKVIITDEITAVARDGIELTARIRITLKTDLRMIVSGPGEDTIKSRINEGVVSIIGEAETHRTILQNTYVVGERIMANPELWEDTAYNVISVDIIDLKVGRDVGSELRAKRADSEMSVHRAKEQEMRALAAEAEVLRIKAESEVQQAMADAFRDGQLSIHEYHNMQNKEADTMMRKSFSKQPHLGHKEFDDDDDD